MIILTGGNTLKNLVSAMMAAVLASFFGACGLVSYTSMDQGTEIKEEQLAKIKRGMTKQDQKNESW